MSDHEPVYCSEPVCVSRTATRPRANNRGMEIPSPAGTKEFSFFPVSKPALGSKLSAIQWVTDGHLLGVKETGREANHSAPSTASQEFIVIPPPFSHTS